MITNNSPRACAQLMQTAAKNGAHASQNKFLESTFFFDSNF